MQIIIDLDGSICTEERTYSRSMAQPLAGAVESIKRLHEAGHTIIIYSARSWQEYEMTVHWLITHGIPYHQLIMGKPIGDVWIDDRTIPFEAWDRMVERVEQMTIKKA